MNNLKFTLRESDFAVFCVLFVFVISYQIQHLIPQFATLYVREFLYAYIYARVIFAYKHKISSFALLIGAFVLAAFLVALNTYYQYQDFGLALPIRALRRFLNVAMMAPLAAVLLRDERRMRVILGLWAGVVVVGFCTVFYQFIGGHLDWLVQNYIAIRANLIRYKSFLGEPNVGGMSAVLLLVIVFWTVQSKTVRWIGIGVAYFGGLMSLSKAALFGWLVVCASVALYDSFDLKEKNLVIPNRRFRENFVVLGLWMVAFLFSAQLVEYAEVHLRSFVGNQFDVPSAMEDFSDRALFMKYGGDWLRSNTLFFGQSFGRAGSVALEMNVPKALGPHNSYLEIFVVGGLTMLLTFIGLQLLTIKTLITQTLGGNPFAKVLLLLFITISIFMLGYPNIYEPVTGALFWVLIGIGGSGELFAKEALASRSIAA